MADYSHKDDGKLHTRFTELAGCSAAGVRRIAMQRLGLLEPKRTNAMMFGEERHAMFAEEGKRTGRIAQCFLNKYPDLAEIKIDHVEEEIACEMFPGVIVHSRPDKVSFGSKAIIDYKTSVGTAKRWAKSTQIMFYALQYILTGHQIDKAIYLIEQWNEARDKIIGYDRIIIPLSYNEIMSQRTWARPRVKRLMVALKMVREEHGIRTTS